MKHVRVSDLRVVALVLVAPAARYVRDQTGSG
jgi:hypothetical protein